MIIEFALAFVLLVGTGLLVRSFFAAGQVDPGFQPQRALTMNVTLPAASTESRNAVYNAALERAKALPGVKSAGEVDALFELQGVSNLGLRAIEGRAPEVDSAELGSCSRGLFPGNGYASVEGALFWTRRRTSV